LVSAKVVRPGAATSSSQRCVRDSSIAFTVGRPAEVVNLPNILCAKLDILGLPTAPWTPMSEPPPDLRYAAAPGRRERILRAVRASGYASAAALAAELGVHEMTVRRDLRRLSGDGLVRLVHGGASLPDGVPPDGRPWPDRLASGQPAKAAIAARAARDVTAGRTLGLDSGTTVAELARRLPADRNLTVATHSLAAMAALGERPDVTLLGLGGLYHEPTRSFSGPATRRAIAELRLDTLYLSASAISPAGVWCATPYEADTKQALLAAADRVILLADTTKTTGTAPVLVCSWPAIHEVVTDAAGPDWLSTAGPTLTVAG
jgi:DeoR family fructose operon transcriptional repressor